MGRFFGPTPNIISAEGFFRGSAAPGAQPKTWTFLTTGFEASLDNYYQIFYLNDHWVITTFQPGVRVTVIRSTDGVHWGQNTVVTAANTLSFPGATFGNGLYVVLAMDNGQPVRLLKSPDLATWTARTTGLSGFVNDPVFGGGTFLVTAIGSAYATSTNGTSWTVQSTYVPTTWAQPIWDGTQFVAPVINGANNRKIVTSPDGINWTEASAALTLSFPAVMANRGTSQYVVGDGATNIGNSLNGALTSVAPFHFQNADGTAWIAYGSGSDWARCDAINALTQSSPDGLVWADDILPGQITTINNMAWNGSEWIAVGSQTGAINGAMSRGA